MVRIKSFLRNLNRNLEWYWYFQRELKKMNERRVVLRTYDFGENVLAKRIFFSLLRWLVLFPLLDLYVFSACGKFINHCGTSSIKVLIDYGKKGSPESVNRSRVNEINLKETNVHLM